MAAFFRRLTANEVGETDGNTRGDIYIPKDCLGFFPEFSSQSSKPKKVAVPIKWGAKRNPQRDTVTLTLYAKGEAHLHRLPEEVMNGATTGDIIEIAESDGEYEVFVHRAGTRGHEGISKGLGDKTTSVEESVRLTLTSRPKKRHASPRIETAPPLLDGPPSWASGWGEDEDFGPFVEIKVGTAKQRLRWIPNGSFLMGSPGKPENEGQPDEEPGRFENEGPQHFVTISDGFWMFDTPVTQDLYKAVTGGNPSRFVSPKRPVEQVSWENAQGFLQKLNGQIPGLEASLPTEAQWEYACRAGTTDALYSGPIEIIGNRNAPALDPIAWYGGNCGVDFDLEDGVGAKWGKQQYEFEKGGTREVGNKQANPWGLYDMLGNVYEWCDDGIREYSENAAHDPRGPTGESALRVIRGGSWRSNARSVRAAYRDWYSPVDRVNYLGFRCRVP